MKHCICLRRWSHLPFCCLTIVAVLGLIHAASAETWRGLTVAPEHRCAPYDKRRDYGSTKIRGVKRRDRLPSEGRASVRGRRLDVQPSMSATLTPRRLEL